MQPNNRIFRFLKDKGLFVVSLGILVVVLIEQVSFYDSRDSSQGFVSSASLTSLLISLQNSYLINGRRVPRLFLTNLEGRDTTVTFKNRKTILLVYSEISCNQCVDTLLTSCNRLVGAKKDNEMVIGLAQSSNIDYVRRFARIENLKFPLLWDKQDTLIEPLRDANLPALLMVDKDGIVVNSLIFNHAVAELNPLYIRAAIKWLNE